MNWQLMFSTTCVIPYIEPAVSEGARYWRLLANESQHASNYALSDFEMRNTASGPDITTVGQTIYGVQDVTDVATNVFDADVTTRWLGNNTVPADAWVGQDFGEGNSEEILEIVLYMHNFEFSGILGFEFQYSHDAVIWETAFSISGEANWASTETRTYTIPEVVLSAPVNTVAPSIEGFPYAGYDVSVNVGSWTGVPYPTFTYQWFLNSTEIVGETNASYTILSSDVGDDLTVEVTAHNSENPSGVMVTSAAIVPAEAPEDLTPIMTFTSAELLSAAGPLNLTYPSGISAGDLLVIIAGTDYPGTSNKYTTPAGWTLHGSFGSTTSDNVLNIYSKPAVGNETGTFALLGDGNYDRGAFMIRLTSPVGSSVEFGVVSSPFYGTSNMVIPSITTVDDDSLIMGIAGLDGGDSGTFGWPGSWTAHEELNIGSASGLSMSFATNPQNTAGATGDTSVNQTTSDGQTGVQFSVNTV